MPKWGICYIQDPNRSTGHYDSFLVVGGARCKNLSFTLERIIHHGSDFWIPEKFHSRGRPQNFCGLQIGHMSTQRPALSCLQQLYSNQLKTGNNPNVHQQVNGINKLWYFLTMELFNNKKELTTNAHNTDEPQSHYAEQKKTDTKECVIPCTRNSRKDQQNLQ